MDASFFLEVHKSVSEAILHTVLSSVKLALKEGKLTSFVQVHRLIVALLNSSFEVSSQNSHVNLHSACLIHQSNLLSGTAQCMPDLLHQIVRCYLANLSFVQLLVM